MAYHGLLTDREDADDVDSKLNLCRSIYDVRWLKFEEIMKGMTSEHSFTLRSFIARLHLLRKYGAKFDSTKLYIID